MLDSNKEASVPLNTEKQQDLNNEYMDLSRNKISNKRPLSTSSTSIPHAVTINKNVTPTLMDANSPSNRGLSFCNLFFNNASYYSTQEQKKSGTKVDQIGPKTIDFTLEPLNIFSLKIRRIYYKVRTV